MYIIRVYISVCKLFIACFTHITTDPSQENQIKRKNLEVAQWSCSYKKFKRFSRVGYG